MDEKTEDLRDIFLDVADDETVTESQEETRGTLATDGESVDERLVSVIDQLREKFGVQTDLSDEELCTLVRDFYAGESDEEIATELGKSETAIFEARMAIHLLRDAEIESDLDRKLREMDHDVIENQSIDELAGELNEEVHTVERAVAYWRARDRSRRGSYRFRTAFEEVLTDADLTVQFTAGTLEDGLEDATEGAETNVGF